MTKAIDHFKTTYGVTDSVSSSSLQTISAKETVEEKKPVERSQSQKSVIALRSAEMSSQSPLKRIRPRAGKPKALKVRQKRSKAEQKTTCKAVILPPSAPSESEATLINSDDEQTFRPPY